MRKLIAFDDDTAAKLTQLARDRMATFQELADEAFADLLKKHGIPIDLKDALRKSARQDGTACQGDPPVEAKKTTRVRNRHGVRHQVTRKRHWTGDFRPSVLCPNSEVCYSITSPKAILRIKQSSSLKT